MGGADITLLSTYSHNLYSRVQDYDATELKQGYRTGENVDRQFSQEARANFEGALFGRPLKGVAGVYYMNANYSADDMFIVPLSYVLGLTGQCPVQAACDTAYGAEFVNRGNLEGHHTKTRAAFAELDYVIDRLTVTAGVRYDAERQTRVLTGATAGTSALARKVVGQLIAGGVFSADGMQNLQTDNAVWLPKLGLRYALAPGWVAGLTAQRGYRTGGVDYSYLRGSNAFSPEFTKNYEASLKGVLENGMMLALNAYRVNWTDQQVNVGRGSLDTFFVNAGSSRLQGLEAELRGKVLPQLELFGAVGVAGSRFIDFVSPQGDFAGKQFARSPRQTASAGFSWTPGRWLLNGNVVQTGGTFTGPENVDRNDGHAILGAKVSYTLAKGVSLFVFGSNLTDRRYISANHLTTVTDRYAVTLGSARQFGFGIQGKI